MDYPFISCLQPRKIVTSNGDKMSVRCGSCEACLLTRKQKLTQLCELHEKDYKYCMFVTLTYKNEYVPYVTYEYHEGNEVTGDFYAFKVSPRLLPFLYKGKIKVRERYQMKNDDFRFGYVLYKHDSVYKDFVRSHKIHGKDFIPNLSKKCALPFKDSIPYCSVIDLQLFHKRLKQYFIKHEITEKITNFSVCEFGPVHFRPHFHCLFYFNDRRTFDEFSNALSSSWLYGRIDYSLSRGKCGGYVAKYLNSVASVPSIFRNSPFKTFCSHSPHFALELYKDKKKEIYEYDYRRLINDVRSIFDESSDISLWRSFASTFFPKVRGFNSFDSRKLWQLYTIYPILSKAYGCSSISEISWHVFQDLMRLSNTQLYDGFRFEISSKDINCFYLPDYNFSFVELFMRTNGGQYKIPTLEDIQSDLYISKHFYSFCCDNNPKLIKKRIEQIKSFYSQLSLFYLKQFYNKLCDCNGMIYENLMYDNYIPSEDEVLPSLEGLTIYKHYFARCKERFSNNIKHKKINDLNNIFVYG